MTNVEVFRAPFGVSCALFVTEDVYRLYRQIYPEIPHVAPAAIQTQLTWMAERDPHAKAAKPEQFIDETILREIDKSGFVAKLYQK